VKNFFSADPFSDAAFASDEGSRLRIEKYSNTGIRTQIGNFLQSIEMDLAVKSSQITNRKLFGHFWL
jgi:hypothetical protein